MAMKSERRSSPRQAARLEVERLLEGREAEIPAPLLADHLRGKRIKIGAKVISHGRYAAFQMVEAAVPRMLFAEILGLIAELRPRSWPLPAGTP